MEEIGRYICLCLGLQRCFLRRYSITWWVPLGYEVSNLALCCKIFLCINMGRRNKRLRTLLQMFASS
ncbi:hypothetical protein MKW98_031204 [Papaver atlanticum]|uniref:Uncharacterized protein n=1 Tax=Papaver atlanticum TaxID=357466 RepID=A0AAD4XRX6_9MAGN|nr:hypothetical protein MKW98_031204 [Papaver atlanticum]